MKIKPLTWRGGEYEIGCVGLSSDAHVCSIMHETTCQVSILDMPPEWEFTDNPVNTVILPCSHVFHPTAIAQHFAYRNMRCPVCRTGSDVQMQLHRSDVPTEVCRAITIHVQSMITDDAHDDIDSISSSIPEIDVQLIRNFLCLRAEVITAGEIVVSLQTRLLPQIQDEVSLFELFSVHRSFQRMLFSNFHRCHSLENSAVRFYLLHPILNNPVDSSLIDIKTLLDASVQTDMTCMTTGDEVLARVITEDTLLSLRLTVNIPAVRSMCVHTVYAQVYSEVVGFSPF